MKVLKIAGIVILLLILLIAGAGIYVKTALPNTGPAPQLHIERTAQRIERGAYLANHVAVCIDCHSKRDWSTFAGPMVAGSAGMGGEAFTPDMDFPGTFYAPNITPYALGKWTDGEIFRAVTTGVSKDGRALFPVMGYHRFGQMDREDIYSIIAYIRTLAPVKNEVPASQPAFPVNILINTMPQPAAFTKRPDESDHYQYGAYLINACGCVECHSKADKGAIVAGTEYGGGREFRQPGGIIRSANITMDEETGIGSWSRTGFVQRFKSYADSGYHAPRLGKGDLNSPMPWAMYAGMKQADLEAIYDYLKSVKPIRNSVVRTDKLAAQ